ncbi:uncharacterized protein TNCV_26281 [Trichonephila clavipes]|uniref:Uncharacterized protein n=1 Tax=Trichonephila clavipes TaxID=2585209 RepID=A0A8X7BBZ7_TRICX|nr:uncharacterized protein TNCV_26281 [Trichonephila clavipes]
MLLLLLYLSSIDIPFMLNWRQIWLSRRTNEHVNTLSRMLRYNSGMRASVILLKNFPLNAFHEWQYYRFKLPDVQICSQCFWDNHECDPAAIGNRFPDHDSRSRFSVSRPKTV